MPKGFTVRLDDEQAEELEAIAEEIRQASGERIVERRKDTEFQGRLRKSIEDNQKILERLAR